MKQIALYMQKKKYFVVFLLVLFLFSVLVGIAVGLSHVSVLEEDVLYFQENFNFYSYHLFFFHFFVLVISFFASFLGVGGLIILAFWFYEGMSCGFLLAIFSFFLGWKGLLFAFLFIIFIKGINLFFSFFFTIKSLEMSKKMIGKYFFHYDVTKDIHKLAKALCLLLFLFCINDIFLTFLAPKIVMIFHFLLT